MNVREYIESGVLELYIFDQLSEADREEVENICAQYPEVLSELEAIQASINGYAISHKRNLDPALKNRILAKLELTDDQSPKTIKMDAWAGSAYRWLAAASIALFIVSLCANMYMYRQYQSASDQLASLQARNTTLADNNAHLTKEINTVSGDFAVISSASDVKLELAGLPLSPAARALIFWDRQRRSTYINMSGLPPIAEGKQYQLWAIVDGKPVDLGMLPTDNQGTALLHVKDVSQPQAFAITIEPKGGSPSPTMDQMIVIGKM